MIQVCRHTWLLYNAISLFYHYITRSYILLSVTVKIMCDELVIITPLLLVHLHIV